MKPTIAAPCLALVLGVLGSQRLVRASAFTFENGVYTLYPGNFSFSAINDAGQIVGTNSSTQRGFVFANGVFTTIPGTNPVGINNPGQILEGPNGSAPGVLVTNGVSMTLPNVPNTAFTHYTGLNDAGALVGFYETLDGSAELGFLYANGLFATVSFPGSFGTRAFGINDAGQIVGMYFPNGRFGFVDGFLDSNGVFTTIDVPGTVNNIVWGISNSGYMVGTSVGSFLYTNGVFTTIQVPGAYETDVTGVNSAGEVVGGYLTNTPEPAPEPTSLLLVAYGLTALAGIGILRGISARRRYLAPTSSVCS
jgi:uncharacterized membrane protein